MMLRLRVIHCVATVIALFVTGSYASAQSNDVTMSSRPLSISDVNRQAALSRSGDVSAMTNLTHQLFRNAGILPELADAFGFTARIVRAESEYRSGTHAAVHEADIVTAMNNLAYTLQTPAWAHTTQTEVRRVRMHLLVGYPQLIGSQDGPDHSGKYHALSSDLSPIEASFVLTSLIYQKVFNPDYQFTEQERVANQHLDSDAVKAEHLKREDQLLAITHGRSENLSIRDMIPAADALFNDIGILSVPNRAELVPSVPTTLSSTKGGR